MTLRPPGDGAQGMRSPSMKTGEQREKGGQEGMGYLGESGNWKPKEDFPQDREDTGV